jgi:transcriptional antiterminator RfaH
MNGVSQDVTFPGTEVRNSPDQLIFQSLPGEEVESDTREFAWFCARTKPKHEHIAAANLRKNLELEVFNPRLSVERTTRRGIRREIEAVFPCYIFVRCVLDDSFAGVQHTNGISTLVHFGKKIPRIPDEVICELQGCFQAAEAMPVQDRFAPGEEVVVSEGAFRGMRATVLRAMPARQRVLVLLDILGRPNAVEVECASLARESRISVADLAPALARDIRVAA